MPSTGEGAIILIVIGAALVPVAIWIGLVVWARRVGARHPETSLFRRLWLVPALGIAAQAAGLVVSSFQLLRLFEVVADAPATERSEILSRGLPEMTAASSLGTCAALVLGALTVVLGVVGSASAAAKRA